MYFWHTELWNTKKKKKKKKNVMYAASWENLSYIKCEQQNHDHPAQIN